MSGRALPAAPRRGGGARRHPSQPCPRRARRAGSCWASSVPGTACGSACACVCVRAPTLVPPPALGRDDGETGPRTCRDAVPSAQPAPRPTGGPGGRGGGRRVQLRRAAEQPRAGGRGPADTGAAGLCGREAGTSMGWRGSGGGGRGGAALAAAGVAVFSGPRCRPSRPSSLPPSLFCCGEGGLGGGRFSPVPSPPVGRAEAVREALSGLPSPTALAVVADTRAAGSCGREAETSLGGAGAGPEAGRGCCAGAGKVAVKRTALPPLPSEFPALLHPLLGRPPGSEARSNAAQRGRCGTATAATVAPFIPFLLANRCISGKAFQHFLENIPISFNLGSEHKFPYDSDHFIRRLFLSKDTWKAVRQLKHPSHLDGPRVTSRGLESACSRLANHLPPSPAVTAAGRRPGRSEPDSERSDSVTLPLPWIESWALWPPSAVLTNPAT